MASSRVRARSWPSSALVVGVKIGSGSRSAFTMPGGSGSPLTVPCFLYSDHAEGRDPVRRHHQQAVVADLVDVAHLARPELGKANRTAHRQTSFLSVID